MASDHLEAEQSQARQWDLTGTGQKKQGRPDGPAKVEEDDRVKGPCNRLDQRGPDSKWREVFYHRSDPYTGLVVEGRGVVWIPGTGFANLEDKTFRRIRVPASYIIERSSRGAWHKGRDTGVTQSGRWHHTRNEERAQWRSPMADHSTKIRQIEHLQSKSSSDNGQSPRNSPNNGLNQIAGSTGWRNKTCRHGADGVQGTCPVTKNRYMEHSIRVCL